MNGIALSEVVKILIELQSDWEDEVEHEAFNVAINAVNKLISYKTDEQIKFTNGIIHGLCKCGTKNSNLDHYCRVCGQKLNWN